MSLLLLPLGQSHYPKPFLLGGVNGTSAFSDDTLSLFGIIGCRFPGGGGSSDCCCGLGGAETCGGIVFISAEHNEKPI